MGLKHSKYKNTGLLFEFLIRQVTSDTLKNKNSKAVGILKEFYTKGEINKEYSLYNTIIESKGSFDDAKGKEFLSELIDIHSNFKYKTLNREKYNLIKEIKKYYDVDEIFSYKIKDYKEYASIYKLLEHHKNKIAHNIPDALEDKKTILEYMSPNSIKTEEINEDLKEIQGLDKETKLLTFQILSKKFNEKYKELNENQKNILSQYINCMGSSSKLREFYNKKVGEIKGRLLENTKKSEDKIVKIKLEEISNNIKVFDKSQNVTDDVLLELLLCEELIDEIENLI
jgi:hypothetical protein